MSFKTLLLSAAMVAFLSGCATKTVQLESSTGSAYRGKIITYSMYEKPPAFMASSAGKAAFGALGAGAMLTKGNALVKDNNIQDPAATIGVTIATDLAQKYGLTLVHPPHVLTENNLSEVAASYANTADLVLDVQSRGWGYSYFPLDWNNYYIIYSAKLRLIDTKQAKELAVGSFAYDSQDDPTPPTNEELLLNGAAGLKAELVKAQNQCILETRQRIFNAR